MARNTNNTKEQRRNLKKERSRQAAQQNAAREQPRRSFSERSIPRVARLMITGLVLVMTFVGANAFAPRIFGKSFTQMIGDKNKQRELDSQVPGDNANMVRDGVYEMKHNTMAVRVDQQTGAIAAQGLGSDKGKVAIFNADTGQRTRYYPIGQGDGKISTLFFVTNNPKQPCATYSLRLRSNKAGELGYQWTEAKDLKIFSNEPEMKDIDDSAKAVVAMCRDQFQIPEKQVVPATPNVEQIPNTKIATEVASKSSNDSFGL